MQHHHPDLGIAPCASVVEVNVRRMHLLGLGDWDLKRVGGVPVVSSESHVGYLGILGIAEMVSLIDESLPKRHCATATSFVVHYHKIFG